MFRIEYDEDSILLKLTLKGYWTMEEFKAYEAEVISVVQQINRRHKNFRILSESAEFEVQSIEIGAAFAEGLGIIAKANAGPIALVAGSILNKMQAERVFPYPNVRVFLDSDAAREWIFRDGALPQEEE